MMIGIQGMNSPIAITAINAITVKNNIIPIQNITMPMIKPIIPTRTSTICVIFLLLMAVPLGFEPTTKTLENFTLPIELWDHDIIHYHMHSVNLIKLKLGDFQ